MTTRTWSCMCGSFEGQVKGDAVLACWCHCGLCRKQTGAAMQLGVFPEFNVLKGGDNLNAFKANPNGGTTRFFCKTCGSFCYRKLPDDSKAIPLGALEGGPVVKPTCHIFIKDKGDQDVMFPELPQYQEFP